jgi:hypothetical protein
MAGPLDVVMLCSRCLNSVCVCSAVTPFESVGYVPLSKLKEEWVEELRAEHLLANTPDNAEKQGAPPPGIKPPDEAMQRERDALLEQVRALQQAEQATVEETPPPEAEVIEGEAEEITDA